MLPHDPLAVISILITMEGLKLNIKYMSKVKLIN